MRRLLLKIAVVALVQCAISLQAQQTDLNVAMMQSTFMLKGNAVGGGTTEGTGFLLMRPLPGQNPKATTVSGKMVLVTAAHVFEGMAGEESVILWRSRRPNSDIWSIVPARFKIRDAKGQPLWKKHPSADVAVMYVQPPTLPIEHVVTTALLADDDMLKKDEVGPGVELKCLGYPLGGAANASGFPVLRTGVIASYPLLPTANTQTFLMDFRVFKGNSGGPVYFSQPIVKGGSVFCCPPQFIMGLVSEESLMPMTTSELYETKQTNYQLSLGIVVHASIIKEAIDLLPSPERPESTPLVVPIEVVAPAAQKP